MTREEEARADAIAAHERHNAAAEAYPRSSYAWRITTDHLFTDDEKYNDVGTQGPSNAPAELIAALDAGKGKAFRMYDDDGELYYTGRLVLAEGAEMDEEACAAPLYDYGQGGAGWSRVHGDPLARTRRVERRITRNR